MINFRELVDLKILLLQLGIQFKTSSSGFTARCPNVSHRDEHPSWKIYNDTGHHVCFSCGFEGSLNYLVKYMTGKPIWEFCKIGAPENFIFKKSLESEIKQEEVKRRKGCINFSGGKTYSVYEDDEVVSYLLKRRVHPDFIKEFHIRFCYENTYNTINFYNRLLIPIYENGRLVSMEGRDYTGKQNKKVLYPDEASVNTLFNIDNLDRKKPLYIVEGLMDLHKIWTHISKNSTSPFGANLTPRQMSLLDEFDCIFIPDPDKAGYAMVKKFDSFTEKEFQIVNLINRKDPGAESILELKKAIDNKMSAARYFMLKNKIYNNEIITW